MTNFGERMALLSFSSQNTAGIAARIAVFTAFARVTSVTRVVSLTSGCVSARCECTDKDCAENKWQNHKKTCLIYVQDSAHRIVSLISPPFPMGKTSIYPGEVQMIKTIREETLDDWARRTRCEMVEGETTIHGVPLEGDGPTPRIYTFEGEPSVDQLEEYFNDLYSKPGNHWRWKTIKLVPKAQTENAGHFLCPVDYHRPAIMDR